MATIFRSQVPQAFVEWATEVFNNAFRSREQANIFRRITKVRSSERAYEEAWEVSGLGTLFLKGEGTPVVFDNVVQGNRTRHTMQTFALGVRHTHEARSDDRWQVMERLQQDLAHSSRDHMERLAHGPYNDAFTGASFTGLDGQPLVSATHTQLKLGTTQSNVLAPPADLNETSLEALHVMADLWQDDSGRFIPFEPKLLLIHPSQRFNAIRLLDSSQRVGTDFNDVNAVARSRMGTQEIRSPYLTDSGAWFLIDDTVAEVIFWDRESANGAAILDFGADFATKDMMVTAMYRAAAGFWNPDGIFGSSGE